MQDTSVNGSHCIAVGPGAIFHGLLCETTQRLQQNGRDFSEGAERRCNICFQKNPDSDRILSLIYYIFYVCHFTYIYLLFSIVMFILTYI